MNTLLTPEDSKRVADALIEKIKGADFDMASGYYLAAENPLNEMSEAVCASIHILTDSLAETVKDHCEKIRSQPHPCELSNPEQSQP